MATTGIFWGWKPVDGSPEGKIGTRSTISLFRAYCIDFGIKIDTFRRRQKAEVIDLEPAGIIGDNDGS